MVCILPKSIEVTAQPGHRPLGTFKQQIPIVLTCNPGRVPVGRLDADSCYTLSPDQCRGRRRCALLLWPSHG